MADISVDVDGAHTVAIRASDVAGNVSTEQRLSVKVDRTPPELAVFEPQQASDPTRITVAASDRTSGLADGGQIRLRRVAPDAGPWITLRATREGERYYAHLNNTSLVAGDYEFRATVPDQAGNETTATNDRTGRNEILHITPTQVGPYPTRDGDGQIPAPGSPVAQDIGATIGTRISSHAVKRTITRRKKCTRRKHARQCGRAVTHEELVHDLRVPFGNPAIIRGTLTADGGRRLGGAEVTVLMRPLMAGGEYLAAATVSTHSDGTFTYRVPPGPGRSLDFHFRGDTTYKHADDQVTLRVPAKATIAANRHAVRNGQRVRFSGRVLGKPVPRRGKLLALQAYYRHKWRTFATPRASLRGRWRYTYRFQATRGIVRYGFRIRVPATSDYPYELGYSKATRVRVVGK
jgi:hypothetical protein